MRAKGADERRGHEMMGVNKPVKKKGFSKEMGHVRKVKVANHM